MLRKNTHPVEPDHNHHICCNSVQLRTHSDKFHTQNYLIMSHTRKSKLLYTKYTVFWHVVSIVCFCKIPRSILFLTIFTIWFSNLTFMHGCPSGHFESLRQPFFPYLRVLCPYFAIGLLFVMVLFSFLPYLFLPRQVFVIFHSFCLIDIFFSLISFLLSFLSLADVTSFAIRKSPGFIWSNSHFSPVLLICSNGLPVFRFDFAQKITCVLYFSSTCSAL